MQSNEASGRVSVTDLDMPFLSMVRFMVKWAIASIPAFLILIILGVGLWLGVLSLGAAMTSSLYDHAASGGSSSGSSKDASSEKRSAPDAPKTDPAVAAYLPSVAVRNERVAKSTLGDDAVFGEIKNLGDRTLKEVELTIYGQDKDGKVIFEKAS